MPARGERRRLVVALALLAAFVVVEVAVAMVSGSLALLSDAGHMVSDVGALAVSVLASYLADRPARGAWTFGLKRAEILSAAGSGITLLVVAVVIAVEAIRRLIHPPEVAGTPVFVVALVGIGVNVAATWVLSGARHANLNAEGAFRHVLTDLYGFIGTAVAGALIMTTGFLRADPIASLLVVVLMLHAALGLLRDSGRILLEGAPGDINLADIRGHLTSIDHVHDVHDLHVWTVTSDLPALSAHVVVDDSCFHDGHVPRLLDQLQGCLAGHFDVEHSTFQFEPVVHAEHEHDTHA
jgi:cobalt-zinc-cadmium efflux system protein